MANSPKFSEEAEAAILVLRAIVTSKKGSSTVQSVLADFRELEGGPLMYKKFGFPNADEFLKATGEFVVQSRMGETIIFAKPNKESLHIKKMVDAQRSTKTKKSGFAIQRQPQKRTGGNNWNPSAYNKMYTQMPYQTNRYPVQKKYPPQQQQYSSYQRNNNNQNNPLKGYFASGPGRYSHPNQNQQNNNQQPKPLMSLKIAPPTQNTLTNRLEANNNNSAAKNLNRVAQSPAKTGQQGSLSHNDLRHKINDKSPPTQQQRQSSSLDLKNRANQQDLLMTAIGQPREINKEAIHKTVYDVVASNQAYNAPSPISPPRSVNARLQVTKDVIPTAEPVQQQPIVPTPAPNGAGVPRQEFLRTARPHPMVLTPPPTPVVVQLPTLPGKKSLQDRLKISQKVDSADLEKASKVITPQTPPPKAPDFNSKNFVSSAGPPLTPPESGPQSNTAAREPFSWNMEYHTTPVELLVQYAEHNRFTRPIYKYFRLKNQRFQCRVTVNDSTYSTYPADFGSQFESQFAAAQLAIDNIKRDEDSKNYSVCLESDFEIANKIYELLLGCPSGMFSKKIPDAFRQAHQSLLPDHWESEIMLSRPRMFVKEELSPSSAIYFAKKGEESDENPMPPNGSTTSVDLVVLPWHETDWNLYITNPASTVEIWARLVGPQYSDRMDALSTEIELAMMDDSAGRRVKICAVGEYYLAFNMDWHRVRVEEIDNENKTAMCFYLDIGDREMVALEDIYLCEPRFLELPGQSVCFTLDKLEDFGENPKAKLHLDELISGKVCIGRIMTTKEEYEKYESIKVTLFDTSSDDDINLNEMIQRRICEDTPVPELQRKGVTTVIISYVDDDCNVHGQLKDTGAMVYIQKLINNLVQSNALESEHQGLYQTASAVHQLYLVLDEDDHKWYRASLAKKEAGSKCRVLFVDFGIRKSIAIANMYRLESLSVALCRYPPQAIRMKMFDIPEINGHLQSRLRALLKPGLTAMVKVVTYAVLPLVKIYMHLDQNNILVCVNDSIRAEMELEINSEAICDPRIAASESSSESTISSVRLNSSIASDYSLNSQDAAEISKKFSGLAIEQRKFSSPVPSQVVPRLTKCPLPSVGDLFEVTVTIASSPNYFIVQPYEHARELNRLMLDLQTYCTDQAQKVDNVQQGEVYAGFDSDDGNWYRVLIVNILCGTTLIHVYFCDFGKIKMLDSKLLRVLPQQFRELPQQAVKAKLHGVRPRHGDWSTEDAVRFQQLTADKAFASYIRSIQADEFNPNESIVELELIDVTTSGDDDILVHQVLVDEARAVLTST